jgi:23S rRNA (guanine1835-N2)-methyltransferase
MSSLWNSPTGPLTLLRQDGGDGEIFAWDGTDRFLVEALTEHEVDGPVLVVDDRFGALACALGERCGGSWTDHTPAATATVANRARNGLTTLSITDQLVDPPPVAAALVRLPREQRRLRWLAWRLGQVLPPGTPVWFGARSKDVQQSAVAVIDAALGPAKTTRARHRSRLIQATVEERDVPEPVGAKWAHQGATVRAWPGVFGETKLDKGAAVLAGAIRDWGASRIVDLGCGTGILGLLAARANPTTTIDFRDSSALAIASAERSWQATGLDDRGTFIAADVLDGVRSQSVDVVLCNPPFHAGRTLTRVVAHRMIAGSARVLRPDGRLILVGNRHLGYHERLPRHFGGVRVACQDRRFVVFEATNPRL